MKSIPIIYQGGSYGSYLTWLLDMMFTDTSVYSPFNLDKGNSHASKNSARLRDIDAWLLDPKDFCSNPWFKVHPKTNEHQSFINNIQALTSYFKKSILLYPSKNTYLLHCNNYVAKIWEDFWSGPLGYINVDNLYDNFNISRDIKLEDVPRWIIREWLSYNFFNSMNSQLEWYIPDQYKNENCMIIFIDDLLYDTESTLLKIQKFINLPFTKDFKEIALFHNTNMSAQKFLNQDKLANDIVCALANNNSLLSWNADDLTFITETWIQQWIRINGYDFKCDNLNNFPTSTKELIQLL